MRHAGAASRVSPGLGWARTRPPSPPGAHEAGTDARPQAEHVTAETVIGDGGAGGPE